MPASRVRCRSYVSFLHWSHARLLKRFSYFFPVQSGYLWISRIAKVFLFRNNGAVSGPGGLHRNSNLKIRLRAGFCVLDFVRLIRTRYTFIVHP